MSTYNPPTELIQQAQSLVEELDKVDLDQGGGEDPGGGGEDPGGGGEDPGGGDDPGDGGGSEQGTEASSASTVLIAGAGLAAAGYFLLGE